MRMATYDKLIKRAIDRGWRTDALRPQTIKDLIGAGRAVVAAEEIMNERRIVRQRFTARCRHGVHPMV
jgi:hypothetical protein